MKHTKLIARILLLAILSILLGSVAFAQPVAKPDTIFHMVRIPFKPDTLQFKLLANDQGGTIKIIEYNINCVRYVPGTTWRTVKNFGKIRIAANGTGTFITTAPTLASFNWFNYSINDGKCGTSQAKVITLDSFYYWANDPTKVYCIGSAYGYIGYFSKEGSEYYIVWPDCKELITEEKYLFAMEHGIKGQ